MKKKIEHKESLGYLVRRVGKKMSNSVQAKLRELGLDIPHEHMVVMFMLWRKDGINQKEIAGDIIKDKSTITRGLNYLEKHNIIVRITDEKDKRSKKIFLTHKGKDMKKQVEPMMFRINKNAAQGVSKKDLETCKKVLTQIFENLKIN